MTRILVSCVIQETVKVDDWQRFIDRGVVDATLVLTLTNKELHEIAAVVTNGHMLTVSIRRKA